MSNDLLNKRLVWSGGFTALFFRAVQECSPEDGKICLLRIFSKNNSSYAALKMERDVFSESSVRIILMLP